MTEHRPPGDDGGVPAHPDSGDFSGERGPGSNWPMLVILGLIGAVFVLVVILHLTGVVGPGAHP